METGVILLMRHAERSADPLEPNLSPAGFDRAKKLASYLPATFGNPDFLFASAVSKHSRRPLETLEPLSEISGVAIDASFADQDYGALAQEIRSTSQYDGRLVVICWHHGNIPSFAHSLKAKDGDYPDPWPRDVFNLILEFKLVGNGPRVKQVKEPF